MILRRLGSVVTALRPNSSVRSFSSVFRPQITSPLVRNASNLFKPLRPQQQHGGVCSGGNIMNTDSAMQLIQKRFQCKNISGPNFWRRRPKQIPTRWGNMRRKWLEGRSNMKGICKKVLVVCPKKPNSGLRKVARVKLRNKRVVMVYIPGIGHNLQTHSVVRVEGGRRKDIPGCNLTAIRGCFDLLPVKGRLRRRSHYGAKRPKGKTKPHLRHKWLTVDEDRMKYYLQTGIKLGATEPIPVSPIPTKRTFTYANRPFS